MGIRRNVRNGLDKVIGEERTRALARSERKARRRLATALAPEPAPRPPKKRRPPQARPSTPKPRSRWLPSDPFVPHPAPTMSRHQLLAELHARLTPRTYLEIGVNTGASLALSRVPSIGVDPAFRVDHELECDVQLVRSTSDDFFAREAPLAHLGGRPVDLAFIDGMHLSEYALRDFLNTERLMAPTGIAVLDDMLPRNALEASRERRTSQWAGDVYKVAEVLRRNRPDLVTLLVNTEPTGTVVVAGLDPASAVMDAVYEAELAFCLAADPQVVPQDYLDRSSAVDASRLVELDVWHELAKRREDVGADLDDLWDRLRGLPTGG
ncbi:class I SAM-dependent methyltransferase [Mumia sp. DW29H23]|uniref:class I SAM-dependent methyltransferase n=1 Tax=Mumia sp. DW29H23 TaxID=3421241 RepID=UPI003D6983B6